MSNPIDIVSSSNQGEAHFNIAPELVYQSSNNFKSSSSNSLGSCFQPPVESNRNMDYYHSLDSDLVDQNFINHHNKTLQSTRDPNFIPSLNQLSSHPSIDSSLLHHQSQVNTKKTHDRSSPNHHHIITYQSSNHRNSHHPLAKHESGPHHQLPATPSPSPPASIHETQYNPYETDRTTRNGSTYSSNTHHHQFETPITPISPHVTNDADDHHLQSYPHDRIQKHLSLYPGPIIGEAHGHPPPTHHHHEHPLSSSMSSRSGPRELSKNHHRSNDQLLAVFPQPPRTPPRTPSNRITSGSKLSSISSTSHNHSLDERKSFRQHPLSIEQNHQRSDDQSGRPDSPEPFSAKSNPQYSENLSEWAPTPTFPTTESTFSPISKTNSMVPNLPDWNEIRNVETMQTSLPITLISKDLDYSMRRLLNETVFEELLDDQLGRHRFRAWLIKNEKPESVAKLDMWLDTRTYGRVISAVKKGSMGIHDMYLTPNRNGTVALPPDLNEDLFLALRQIVSLNVSFLGPQKHLLNSLYHHEFQRFVKQQIVSQAHVRLGKFNLRDEDRDGLGDCFCLTNPRIRDHPIVLVSEGFTRVTGYEKHQIVGRNCRFLQGPGTAPQSVQRIRDGLNYGEGCTELLLNYRRDGTPFYCLLCIMPLRDAGGSLVYFIGGQVNVTGLLSGKKGLSFLIGDPSDGVPEIAVGNTGSEEFGNGKYALSPSMQTFNRTEECAESGATIHGGSVASGVLGAKKEVYSAAGYYQTQKKEEPPTPAPTMSLGKKLGFFRRKSEKEKENSAELGASFSPNGGGGGGNGGNQLLVGAEANLNTPRSLDDQMKLFEATYSKLVVFKRDTREIIFATKPLLLFLGLPCSNPKDSYRSSLIHCDFVQLLWSLNPTSKDSNNQLRQHIKKVIKLGMVVSQECQVKAVERSYFFSSNEKLSKLKPTHAHLTPMVERDGQTVAYVCVFG